MLKCHVFEAAVAQEVEWVILSSCPHALQQDIELQIAPDRQLDCESAIVVPIVRPEPRMVARCHPVNERHIVKRSG